VSHLNYQRALISLFSDYELGHFCNCEGYGLEDRGIVVPFTAGATRTTVGPTQSYILRVPKVIYQREKQPECEVGLLPPPTAGVNNACYVTSITPYVFWPVDLPF
jgi:hypothetical protein